MSLVEASPLAGMLIKYEEDFIICSKIESNGFGSQFSETTFKPNYIF